MNHEDFDAKKVTLEPTTKAVVERLMSLTTHFIIPPRFLNEITNPKNHGFVAKYDGGIVGFIEFDHDEKERLGQVKVRFDVLPEYRNFGIGEALLRKMDGILHAKGITHMRFAGTFRPGEHRLANEREAFLKPHGFARKGKHLIRHMRKP